MGLELATEALVGTTSSLKEIHEHPFLPYGIFAEHSPLEIYRYIDVRRNLLEDYCATESRS